MPIYSKPMTNALRNVLHYKQLLYIKIVNILLIKKTIQYEYMLSIGCRSALYDLLCVVTLPI